MTQAALLALIVAGIPPLQMQGLPAVACDSTALAGVAFLRGSWHVRSHEPARTPPRERTGVARVSVIAGGCALREDLRLGDDYEETRILAFDEREGAWQLAIVDSEHGNIISLQGHAVEDGLDFVSTHQRPDGLLIDRVAIRRTSTGWLVRIESAGGYGAPWRALQEIVYTRPS